MFATFENFDFSRLNARLSHLSRAQIIQLINDYYEGKNVTLLIDHYKLDISPAQLFHLFPTVISKHQCYYCQSFIAYPLDPKSKMKKLTDEGYCTGCDHITGTDCPCPNCTENRDQLPNEVRFSMIAELLHKHETVPVPFSQLTMHDRLYLAVVLRAGLNKRTKEIGPFHTKLYKMAPVKKLAIDMLKHCIENKLIIIDWNKTEQKIFEQFGHKVYFDLLNATYQLNVADVCAKHEKDLYQNIMYPKPYAFSINFCVDVWDLISCEESKRYLHYKMKQHGAIFTPSRRVDKIFYRHIVPYFSTAEIYSIINDAMLKVENYTSSIAQDTILGYCEHFAKLALHENLTIEKHPRIEALPETILGEVLFRQIIGVGKRGFTSAPTCLFHM